MIEIKPSKAKGHIEAPPSKSYAHRMLICAGLSKGESIIENIELSQDVLASLDCLEALGAVYSYENNIVKIKGVEPSEFCSQAVLPCRECGTTMRFFITICLASERTFSLTGSERLLSRPMDVYEKICAEKGLLFSNNGSVITVKGPLPYGEYEVPGNVSSQFISGLLFALPFMEKDSRIIITDNIESSSYIDMTISALKDFGIILNRESNVINIKGNQKYKAISKKVEGDFSNVAFIEALNLIGGDVTIDGLNDNTIQGDKVYRDYFIKLKNEMPTLSLADCPDLGPILFVMAACFNGAVFTDTKRLRIKESDRAMAMYEELAKFGAKMKVEENTVTIFKAALHEPAEALNGHNDHRIVMALSVLCTIYGGKIEGENSVNKSWPEFFNVLKSIGIELT